MTPPGAIASFPRGIDESGLVAVVAQRTGATKGYVKSGEFHIDMTPSGWSSSLATAINDRNEVVGYGDSAAGRRSFLRSGAAYEFLDFPGWRSTEAVSVNDSGQVAGSGTTAEGEVHAFLATPASTPLTDGATPAGASLCAGGCAAVPGGRFTHDPCASAATLALLGIPLLLLRRRTRSSGSAFGNCP